jgi:NADH-quinone oxidoreductase subunit J
MDLQAFAFFVLAGVTLLSGLLVVLARNPVHSVLFLITTFFSSAGLFVLLGAEFLAMLLVVVYVGAVAVLFLFVVMMLDVDFRTLREGFVRYLPIGGVVALGLAVEMVLVATAVGRGSAVKAASVAVGGVSNTEQIGRVLYTDYVYFFEAAGMVLLVAMIGAIVLTLRHKPHIKRQKIAAQTARTAATGMVLVKDVQVGAGIADAPSQASAQLTASKERTPA